MYKKESKTLSINEEYSFTGFLTIWMLISLYGEGVFYFLIILGIPNAEPMDSYLRLLIIETLLLSAFPIAMIGVVIPFLPFQKIDYSRQAILHSFGHKLIFLFASPLIFYGYKVAQNLGFLADSLVEPGFGIIFLFLGIWVTILGWIYTSLWFGEIYFGKNTSITLRKLRTERNHNRIDPYSKSTQTSHQSKYKNSQFSYQYASFASGLPMLLIMTAVLLDPQGNIVFGLLTSHSAVLLACLFSLYMIKNYLIKQCVSFDQMNQIYMHKFVENDTSSNTFPIGIMLIIYIGLFDVSFHGFIPNVIFIMIYLLCVLIFIFMVWNNQMKALIHNLLPK